MNFNSKQYSWANVEVAPFGVKMTGCRGIKYKKSQEKEPVYGAGDKPLSIQSGNQGVEGEITMLQSTYDAILDAAKAAYGPNAGINDIEGFDIPVSYKPKVGPIRNDVVKFAEFTEAEKGMSQGDKFMEITVPFIALDIIGGY